MRLSLLRGQFSRKEQTIFYFSNTNLGELANQKVVVAKDSARASTPIASVHLYRKRIAS